jgi:regulator of sigma E protease
MTIIIFLIVLAVLIFVHELGHFLIARWSGIRVDAFAIGFGPKIFSYKKGETEYSLNLIPFGGYVKIFGENPDEQSISGPDASRSFVNKNRLIQACVLIAGIAFNLIFAWIIYATLFSTGITASVDSFGEYSKYINDRKIMVTDVVKDSPASKSGIKVGDYIIASSTKSFGDFVNQTAGKEFDFRYVHNGQETTTKITAIKGLVTDKWAIGVGLDHVGEVKLPFFLAVYESGKYTLVMIRETAVGLGHFVWSIFQGEANFEEVSGPVGIAKIVGNSAKMGISYLAMITAIISINLGIINLIPFPALDGGRLFFVLIESITRKRISPKIANTINGVGFALLMLLMLIVTYKDIVKLFK